jgi:hypothetical protein
VCSLLPSQYSIDVSSEQRALPDTALGKGLIPLVVTRLGSPVRQLRDSSRWQKLVAKIHRMATCAEQDQDLESEGGDEDSSEEEGSYAGYRRNNRDEVQYNATRTHSRSPKEYPTKSGLRPNSESGTVTRQQSVQLVSSDDDVIRPPPPPQSTVRVDVSRQPSTQRAGTSIDPRSHEGLYVFPNNRERFAVPPTTHRPLRDFRSQPSPSGDPTQRGSHFHLPSEARTHHETLPDSARPRLPAPPPNLPPPRQGTKRRNPGWSDDDSARFNTGPYFHRIDAQGRLNPRGRVNSSHPRNPQTAIPQQSYQRHPQRSDLPRANPNKRPRASTSQGHAAHSIPHDDQVRTSIPSTSHQLRAADYHQPQRHQSFQAPAQYTRAHPVPTIEEEEFVHAGDPDDYGSQHIGHRMDDDAHGEGDYFNDGYSVEKRSYEGDIDKFNEYTYEDRGTTFRRQ